MAQRPAQSNSHRHEDEPRPQDVIQALHGAVYPSRKEHLIDLASKNGADGEILAVLKKMADRNFDSESSVLREVTRAE